MKPHDMITLRGYPIGYSLWVKAMMKQLICLLILCCGTSLNAQVRKAFTLRATTDVPEGIFTLKGDFTMLANKNLTAAAYSNSGTNSYSDMDFVDVDADPLTFNSSTAQLSFPARIVTPQCATIKFAGLYWTGRGTTKVVYTTNYTFSSTLFDRNNKIYWYTTSSVVANQNGSGNFRLYYNNTNQTLNTPFGYVYMNGSVPYTGSSAPTGTTGLVSYDPTSNTTKYYVSGSGSTWNESGTWSAAEKQQVMIKGPASGSYQTIDALSEDCYLPGDEDQYSCFADITNYVKTNGLGNYTVANVKTEEGDGGSIGFFGGWGLIVVYEHPDEPIRNITIFDGYAFMNQYTGEAALPIEGFKAVQTGPVSIKMGLMAGEGDVSITGDQFHIVKKANIDDYSVTNANHWVEIPNPRTNELNNYFNSSVIMDGTRNPSQQNNYGFDAHMFTLNNTDNQFIDNNQTKTAFKYTSNQDQYIIFMVAMAVDAYTPEPIAEIFDNATGHQVEPGQEITYSFDVKNQGTEGVDNLMIKIPIPYNTTYAGALTANFSALPTGTCYNTNSISYGTDTIRVTMKHVPGPNDVGSGSCSITGPWDNNKSWAHISFKLRATDQCALLQSECGREINTIGYVSGTGSMTSTKFNVTSIKGWSSGECTVAPIYGANVVTIINPQNCVGDDAVSKEYCAGTTNIPLSDMNGQLPPGTYKFYTANSSWEQTGTIPLTVIPGDGYYLAIPINNFNPDCTGAIKVRILIPALTYRDTIYVKQGYCSNGIDWAHPMGSLQLAMKYARKAVWVAAGTYNSGTYGNNGYTLKDSIKIYGGFRADPTDAVDNDIKFRHPLNNPTVLIQPAGAAVPVVASPVTRNVGTLLNGFFIQGSTRGAAALKDKITLEYCVIRNNSTGSNPVVLFDSGGKLVNSLITANSSSGGILHFANGGALHFSTLTKNSGTAILASGTTAGSVTNSIVWGNTTQTSGSPATAISYSGVQGLNGTTYGTTTNNNIALDPINLNTWGPNFGNAPDDSTEIYNGFRLNLFSRLKGAANNSAVASLALTADLSRVHRIKGANADMGAFESRYLLTPAGNLVWSGNTTHTFWPATATQGNPETSDFVLLHQGTHARLDGHTTLDAVVFNEGPDSLINAGSSAGNNTGVASLFTSNKTLTVSDVYYARRFKPGKWHFIYLPYRVNKAGGVLDSLLQPLSFGTDYSVKWYNGIKRSVYGSNSAGTAGKNWEYVTADTLSKNKGYNLSVLSERVIYFKANGSAGNKDFLGQNNYPLQLTFEPLGNLGAYDGDQGWNLFGIPYSSFYQPNGNISLPANWYETKGAMFNVVFWNSDLSGGDKYVPVVTTLENKLFPPFTALFTEIQGTPNPGDYTLAANGRQYQTVAHLYNPVNLYQARSASTDKPLLIALNLIRAEASDRALIVLNPLASAGFEVGRDMGKFGSSSNALSQLFTMTDGKRLGINEIPPANGNTSVPLHLYIGTAGQHRIRPESNPLIEQNGYSLFLEDTEENSFTPLTVDGYSFTAPTGALDNRFVLHITSASTALQTTGGLLWMTAANNRLTLHGLKTSDRIEVSDVSGRVLAQATATANSQTLTLPYPGIFFVKVYQTTGTVTQKIINK